MVCQALTSPLPKRGSIGSAIFVGLTVVTNSLFLQLVACRLEEYYFGVFLQE